MCLQIHRNLHSKLQAQENSLAQTARPGGLYQSSKFHLRKVPNVYLPVDMDFQNEEHSQQSEITLVTTSALCFQLKNSSSKLGHIHILNT